MADEVEREFPLFPLGLVALPGELVWMADDGLREIGCACEIERVLERMEDGRMNILTRGTRPFRVLERQGHLAYPAGVIAFLSDDAEEPDPEVAETARATYADLVKRATDREPSDEELREMDAYGMAATVDFGLDAKQGLLDLRSENARLKLVTRLFRAATKRLDFVDRAQARARSNGKVRFG
jgi:Lon protease-like protein